MKMKTILLGAACAFALAPAAHAERGTDGEVKLTYPQAVSIMTPYLSAGTKDVIAASMVIEPLAGYDDKGNLIPRLVTEIPTLANGGISADMTSITWKLIPGLLWSDGTPVTADDVIFTANYCMDPAGGCASLAKFDGIKSVEAVDASTVKVTFTEIGRASCRERV